LSLLNWNPIVEALLFAAGDSGLSLEQIATVLEVSTEEANVIIREFQTACKEDDHRGIQVIEMAGSYQLTTKKDFATYIQKLVEVPSIQALSQAALETLAIIAYRQPITRLEIEDVRGVSIDGPLRKLVNRGLVKEVGRTESVGRAILYGTTTDFLEYFGLKSLAEMPELPDLGKESDETDLFSFKYPEKDDLDE